MVGVLEMNKSIFGSTFVERKASRIAMAMDLTVPINAIIPEPVLTKIAAGILLIATLAIGGGFAVLSDTMWYLSTYKCVSLTVFDGLRVF